MIPATFVQNPRVVGVVPAEPGNNHVLNEWLVSVDVERMVWTSADISPGHCWITLSGRWAILFVSRFNLAAALI